MDWPDNVARLGHLLPEHHCEFYNQQRFALSVTRTDMARLGYSPNVRLFEAAACATPIISDAWTGLESFLEPDREIFVAESAHEVLHTLRSVPEDERLEVGQRARRRVLNEHSTACRAEQFETLIHEGMEDRVLSRHYGT